MQYCVLGIILSKLNKMNLSRKVTDLLLLLLLFIVVVVDKNHKVTNEK